MKKKKLLTTGEFAKLCKTTKETLFHYDREDILKPKQLSKNGYRYYEVKQFLDFDVISMLKDTGSSLREIKTYLHDADIKQLQIVLDNKKNSLNRDMRKLIHRKLLLNDMMACLQELSTAVYDTMVISEEHEELLELFQIEKNSLDPEFRFIESLWSCTEYYATQKRIPRGPFGVILCKDENSQYIDQYIFNRGTHLTPDNRRHRKPEGKYATIIHNGTFESHASTLEKFILDIEKSGFSIVGNIYVFDMMVYSMQNSKTSYCYKYSVMVSE